jgi:phosphoribosylamine--glycine ligase
MNVLVIGSGGREHAITWKIRQSPKCEKVYCAPGNAGIAQLAELVPIKANDIDGLLTFAAEHAVDLTIVGPEQPLTEGIVDRFEERRLKIFGPTLAAAALEGSTVFAKGFMQKYGIPTSNFRTFGAQQRFDAERFINESPVPIVVKASGLAAGKGVVVCETKEEALDAVATMMEQNAFGDAGKEIVIEEFLAGEEASLFAITDGKEFVTLTPAQDHKRIFDNDLGKNTGGMGAYAPAPAMTADVIETVKQTIIEPTLLGMAKEGSPFKGCLYVGLMLTATGPKVIEYNCRFGDPETQVVLPLLGDDLLELMASAADGKLKNNVNFHSGTAVCVVISSGGYPDKYETGKKIIGLNTARHEQDVLVFHAGTRRSSEDVVTDGGRVLGITATGPAGDLEQTVDKAYRAVERITFDGAYYRSDIGRKGIERLKQLHSMENP